MNESCRIFDGQHLSYHYSKLRVTLFLFLRIVAIPVANYQFLSLFKFWLASSDTPNVSLYSEPPTGKDEGRKKERKKDVFLKAHDGSWQRLGKGGFFFFVFLPFYFFFYLSFCFFCKKINHHIFLSLALSQESEKGLIVFFSLYVFNKKKRNIIPKFKEHIDALLIFPPSLPLSGVY